MSKTQQNTQFPNFLDLYTDYMIDSLADMFKYHSSNQKWRVKMTQTTVSFQTLMLQHCIDLTRTFDQECFPEEMHLSESELSLLLHNGAEATILRRNELIIGQAITLPEMFLCDTFQEVDSLFEPHRQGVYSYSEAIRPQYQNKGYGTLLIKEIAIRMKERGYTHISAHVRTRYGWNNKRRQKLNVRTLRTIDDFWTNPLDTQVEFQLAIL